MNKCKSLLRFVSSRRASSAFDSSARWNRVSPKKKKRTDEERLCKKVCVVWKSWFNYIEKKTEIVKSRCDDTNQFRFSPWFTQLRWKHFCSSFFVFFCFCVRHERVCLIEMINCYDAVCENDWERSRARKVFFLLSSSCFAVTRAVFWPNVRWWWTVGWEEWENEN